MMNFDEFINIANASFGNIPSSIASSGGYPEPLKNAAPKKCGSVRTTCQML